VYPNIPTGYALARYHFLTMGGDEHAYIITGHHVTVTFTTAEDLANQLFDDYSANAFFGINNSVTFQDVSVVWNDGGLLVDGISSRTPVVGGSTTAPVAPQVAVIAKKITGQIGKHHRGRMYIPGVDTSKVDAHQSNLLTAAQTAFESALQTWAAALITDGVQLALFHRNPAVSPDLVTDLIVEPILATQRRRQRKAPHH
jgi:hypothetical protein